MNYGTLKTNVLRILDEVSVNNGSIQTTADITIKIQNFTNDAQFDVATAAKIPATYELTINPIMNELSKDTSSIKKHIPGQDFSIELAGAKACYFEASGPGTVVIEEKVNDELVEIETIVTTASSGIKEYKRLISPTNENNIIRLRFTGDSLFDYRNYILYPYSFGSEEEVQQHKPFLEYDLPSDFLQIDHVMVKRDSRQYVPFTDFRQRPDNKIAINRYIAPAEVLIHYWRMPKVLEFTGVEATDNTLTFEVIEEAARIMPYFVAGQIKLSENDTTNGLTLLNLYEAKKAALTSNTGNYSATVFNIYGW